LWVFQITWDYGQALRLGTPPVWKAEESHSLEKFHQRRFSVPQSHVTNDRNHLIITTASTMVQTTHRSNSKFDSLDYARTEIEEQYNHISDKGKPLFDEPWIRRKQSLA
jgi:hypothetical protein